MKTKGTSSVKDKLFVDANAAWDRGDLQRAYQLFARAAELGDASSQLDLGYFFDRGLHVKQDKKQAMHWYYRAYRQGEASAANNIATIHRERGHVKRMLWWFGRAVAMGEQDALLELGKYYESAVGRENDTKNAKTCYRRVLRSKYVTQLTREQAKRRLSKLEKHEKHAS